MSFSEQAQKRWGSARLARMARDPRTVKVMNKYADRMRNGENLSEYVAIAGVATMRASGKCSRQEFYRTVQVASKTSGIPLEDLKIYARFQQALFEAYLIDTKQAPIVMDGGKKDELS